MSDHQDDIARLAEEFSSCRQILLALGDENRQHLILELMRMGQCGGVRVGTIAEKTPLPPGRLPPHSNSEGRRSFASAQGGDKKLLLFCCGRRHGSAAAHACPCKIHYGASAGSGRMQRLTRAAHFCMGRTALEQPARSPDTAYSC